MRTQKVKIYEQLPLEEIVRGELIKGWLFNYADIIDPNTVTTEKKQVIWIEDENEAKKYFLLNRQEF